MNCEMSMHPCINAPLGRPLHVSSNTHCKCPLSRCRLTPTRLICTRDMTPFHFLASMAAEFGYTVCCWLDMWITVNKPLCLRVGPRCNSPCSNDNFGWSRNYMWTNKVRYLGVHLVSSKVLSCNFDIMRKSFYHAFNAIYGKVGRLASVDVVIELFKTKCRPMLLCLYSVLWSRCLSDQSKSA